MRDPMLPHARDASSLPPLLIGVRPCTPQPTTWIALISLAVEMFHNVSALGAGIQGDLSWF